MKKKVDTIEQNIKKYDRVVFFLWNDLGCCFPPHAHYLVHVKKC
jgi:hypothetical protein